MSGIKAILWDIDGTLLNFEKSQSNALRRTFSRFSLGECTDEMIAEYSSINEACWRCIERGELSKPQLLEMRFTEFFQNYDIDISLAGIFNSEYESRLGDAVFFIENGFSVVSALEGMVKQYAVTNGVAKTQRKKLADSGLDKIFDGIFISDEIGFEKPSRGFFDIVFECIAPRQRSETMIVGDSLTSDMRGGNNAGILCCWYNPQKSPKSIDVKLDYEIQSLEEVESLIGLNR